MLKAISFVMVLVAGCLLTSATNAKSIEGYEIPELIEVEGKPLILNGAAMRQKYGLDIYLGALYLHEKSTNAASIITSTSTKRVLMHFFKPISKGTIESGWEFGMMKNLSAKAFAQIKPKLDTFNALFTDVEKEQTITLNILENGVVEAFLDSKKLGQINGLYFQQALLKVWLGDNPPTGILKAGMLGL